ncbi:MAG: hypothetical protein ACREPV_00025 [Lysobacter sp.]
MIGNDLGRELRTVFAEPWLTTAVTATPDTQDWRFTRSGRHWLLCKSYIERGGTGAGDRGVERGAVSRVTFTCSRDLSPPHEMRPTERLSD